MPLGADPAGTSSPSAPDGIAPIGREVRAPHALPCGAARPPQCRTRAERPRTARHRRGEGLIPRNLARVDGPARRADAIVARTERSAVDAHAVRVGRAGGVEHGGTEVDARSGVGGRRSIGVVGARRRARVGVERGVRRRDCAIGGGCAIGRDTDARTAPCEAKQDRGTTRQNARGLELHWRRMQHTACREGAPAPGVDRGTFTKRALTR